MSPATGRAALAAALVALAALLPTPAPAQGLRPFGRAQWDDGLLHLIEYVRTHFAKISSFTLTVGSHEADATTIRTGEDLSAVLATAIKGDRRTTPRTLEGTELPLPRYVPAVTARLSCSPVLIQGVPFRLSYEFRVEPGILVIKPDNAPVVVLRPADARSPGDQASVPLCLTRVLLESLRGRLEDDFARRFAPKVADELRRAHGTLLTTDESTATTTHLTAADGAATVELRADTAPSAGWVRIVYESEALAERATAALTAHREKVAAERQRRWREEHTYTDVPDSTSGL